MLVLSALSDSSHNGRSSMTVSEAGALMMNLTNAGRKVLMTICSDARLILLNVLSMPLIK